MEPYPRVFVEYYIRKHDTPQVSIPSRKFKYIPEEGAVCELESKAFHTVPEAQQWIKEQTGIHRPRICDHRTDKPAAPYRPIRRFRPVKIY